jgi:hypothetical protein
MFDLFWDIDKLVEGKAQVKAEIVGSRPFLGQFWVLGLCNGYGDVSPWVYPCLGPFVMYK